MLKAFLGSVCALVLMFVLAGQGLAQDGSVEGDDTAKIETSEETTPKEETKDRGPEIVSTAPISKGSWDLPVKLDEKVSLSKIYTFLNDPSVTKIGHNQPLSYEFKYFNYGAVTEEQKKQKMGHYFVVSWQSDAPSADMVVRLDYRQRATQDQVHTIEVPFLKAQGFHKARFKVIGSAYEKFGKIQSWRVSVVRNGVIVAEKKSYLW